MDGGRAARYPGRLTCPFCKSLVPRLTYLLVMAIVEWPSNRYNTNGFIPWRTALDAHECLNA
jgi:hypothetical protein